MSVREEREGATAGMQKPEEKVPFSECAKASQVDWAQWGRWWPRGTCPSATKLGRIQRKIQNGNWFSNFK
jgi:hypothetical protein